MNDFLKQFVFSREGCFETSLAKIDIVIAFHEVFGLEKLNLSSSQFVNLHITPKNDYGNNSRETSLDKKIQVPVSDSKTLRQVSPDEILLLQLIATAPSSSGFGFNGVPKTNDNLQTGRCVGEIRIPISKFVQSAGTSSGNNNNSSMLYNTWIQLDEAMQSSGPGSDNMKTGQNYNRFSNNYSSFDASLHAGARLLGGGGSGQQSSAGSGFAIPPKICISVFRKEEDSHFPFRENDEDGLFRSRAWPALVQSHQQQVTLIHSLHMAMSKLALSGPPTHQNDIHSYSSKNTLNQNLSGSGGGSPHDKDATRILDGKLEEIRLLERLVNEQKMDIERSTQVVAEKNAELSVLRDRLQKAQEMEVKLQGLETLRENMSQELEMTRSGQDGMLSGIKRRYEEDINTLKGELTKAQSEITRCQSDLMKKNVEQQDLVTRSNKKIDDANSTIVALKTERDALSSRCDQLEVELNTQKVKHSTEIEKLKSENTTLSADNTRLSAKNEELLVIFSQLYDNADADNQVAARESLDAYTAKWS